MDKLNSELESAFNSMVGTFQKEVNDFRTKLVGSSLSHVLTWGATSALCAEEVVRLTRNMKEVCVVNEDFDVDDVIDDIERLESDALDYFKRGQFAPNSTAPMSNLINITKGEAYGKCLEITETLTRIIERHNK
jgi:hypothetical protein